LWKNDGHYVTHFRRLTSFNVRVQSSLYLYYDSHILGYVPYRVQGTTYSRSDPQTFLPSFSVV
jgi:hypothetical protein